MVNSIYTKFSIEGFHQWKDVPKHSSEDYLQHRHRHMFYFKCSVEALDDDREIEFIALRRKIKGFIINNFGIPAEFKGMSCEMIGKLVIDYLQSLYGDKRRYNVDVSEDNESGAVVNG